MPNSMSDDSGVRDLQWTLADIARLEREHKLLGVSVAGVKPGAILTADDTANYVLAAIHSALGLLARKDEIRSADSQMLRECTEPRARV